MTVGWGQLRDALALPGAQPETARVHCGARAVSAGAERRAGPSAVRVDLYGERMKATDFVAAAGVLVAVAGVLAAFMAVRWARNAARAGEASAVAAQDSARAGQESADAAKESARHAAAVADIERQNLHDRLRPALPAAIRGEIRQHASWRSLWGSITVTRDYRVRADRVTGNGSSTLGLGMLLRAGNRDFEIEQWPADRMTPQATGIRLKFWPPDATDGTEPWTCPCGRNTEFGDGSGPGHWEFLVPIEMPQLPSGPLMA